MERLVMLVAEVRSNLRRLPLLPQRYKDEVSEQKTRSFKGGMWDVFNSCILGSLCSESEFQ